MMIYDYYTDYTNDDTDSYETPQFLACQFSRLFLAVGASTTQYQVLYHPYPGTSCFASHVPPDSGASGRSWVDICGSSMWAQYDLVTAPHV